MIDDDPKYLDLLARAAKVRHFLAKNPKTTYKDICLAFPGMKCPVRWLEVHGYVMRSEASPFTENRAPVYSCRPMGVPYDEPTFEPDDEELGIATKKISNYGESDV